MTCATRSKTFVAYRQGVRELINEIKTQKDVGEGVGRMGRRVGEEGLIIYFCLAVGLNSPNPEPKTITHENQVVVDFN